jgi:murein DD-endopeptidase MepM/ murein hydrolase activator NlpD
LSVEKNPITVSGSIYLAEGLTSPTLRIPEKQIPAGTAVEMDLPAGDTHSLDGAAVKVTSSGGNGSIVGNYVSHDRLNKITHSMPFKDIGDYGISTGGYPWRIDGNYQSKVFITNVGKVRAAFGGSIRPENGPEYFIDTHYLEVGETAIFDIRRLRDEQTPDSNGVTLPKAVNVGQFDWTTIFGDGSQRLIGRNEVIDRSSGVSASFSCGGICNCPYSTLTGFITPTLPIVIINGQLNVTATGVSTDSCGGSGSSNFTISPSPWNIATQGYFNLTSGQPTSTMRGTSGGDSFFYTPFTGTAYAWNGQSGACVLNGNPSINPGGSGFTQTPSQHTYPKPPLTGCRISVPFDGIINVTTKKKHQAQDTVGSNIVVGTPVFAPEAGVISAFVSGKPHDTRPTSQCAGQNSPSNFIEINSDVDHALTRLYHVTILPALATLGTHVTAGQQIGTIDISGCTSGPHTHIQRKVGGVLVNFTMPCDNSHFDNPSTYYDDSDGTWP